MREILIDIIMWIIPISPVIIWLIAVLADYWKNRKSNKNKRMPRFNIIHWLIFPRDVPDEKRTPYEMDYKLLYKRYPSRLEIFRYYTPKIEPAYIFAWIVIMVGCLALVILFLLLKKIMISV